MYTIFTLLQADIHILFARIRLSHANLSYLRNILFPNLHKVQTYENRKNVTQ